MATSIVHYLDNLRTVSTHLKSGETIITDAPTDNNGKGEAFSPTDTAATALGSCMLTILGIHVEPKDYKITGSTAEITKHMSVDLPRRIVKIDVAVTIRSSTSLNNHEKTILEKVARTCPVAMSLHPDIDQNFTFVFE